jgi:hypothetical protein
MKDVYVYLIIGVCIALLVHDLTKKLTKKTSHVSNLINNADKLARGVYPKYSPNYEDAKRLYAEAISRTDDLNVRQIAVMKYQSVVPLLEMDAPGPPLTVEEAMREDVEYTDSQNAHDHAVVSSVKRNLEKLESSKLDVEYVYNIISEFLKNDEIEKVRLVMNSLSDQKHGTFQVSEIETLSKVWTAIQRQNPELRANLTETLAKCLLSAHENGHVVCSTGKITRIASALDGTDLKDLGKVQKIQNLVAVRESIVDLATKLRDGGSSSDDFVKTAFIKFVDEDGLSKNVVGPIILDFASGFDT